MQLPFKVAFKLGSVTALPLMEKMRWTQLLGLRTVLSIANKRNAMTISTGVANDTVVVVKA